MAKEYRLQVYTQERLVLDDKVTTLVVPAIGGQLGVLADHAPMIAALGEGRMMIRRRTGEQEMHIKGGFLEVANNSATMLVDSLTDI